MWNKAIYGGACAALLSFRCGCWCPLGRGRSDPFPGALKDDKANPDQIVVDKFIKKAQKRIPEQVLAAIGVQPSGTTAGLAGGAAALQGAAGGVVGTRIAQWRGRRKTGLALTPYMLLAVTQTDVHLFEAGMTWGVKKAITSWPRQDVALRCDGKALTRLVQIHPTGSSEPIVLEAPKGKASSNFARVISSLDQN